jgi:hypothetical protein
MEWNSSIAMSLSTLLMMFDAKASNYGIQHTILAKEHPKLKDLLNKPFYLKIAIKIPN